MSPQASGQNGNSEIQSSRKAAEFRLATYNVRSITGKFYKIFQDAGKFYKTFPCMIPELPRFFKKFPCLHSCNMQKVHAGSTRVSSVMREAISSQNFPEKHDM